MLGRKTPGPALLYFAVWLWASAWFSLGPVSPSGKEASGLALGDAGHHPGGMQTFRVGRTPQPHSPQVPRTVVLRNSEWSEGTPRLAGAPSKLPGASFLWGCLEWALRLFTHTENSRGPGRTGAHAMGPHAWPRPLAPQARWPWALPLASTAQVVTGSPLSTRPACFSAPGWADPNLLGRMSRQTPAHTWTEQGCSTTQPQGHFSHQLRKQSRLECTRAASPGRSRLPGDLSVCQGGAHLPGAGPVTCFSHLASSLAGTSRSN